MSLGISLEMSLQISPETFLGHISRDISVDILREISGDISRHILGDSISRHISWDFSRDTEDISRDTGDISRDISCHVNAPLESIPSTFNDPSERMKWRTKQNLDYAYLMMYCQNRGRYYIQLEDDVITKPGYFSIIKEFISRHSAAPWLLLEFSSLGFIGKLFKSSDLPMVVEFLLIFHRQKPADWLLDHIFSVKFCSPEESVKLCYAVKTKYRLRYKPKSLFQHIGRYSSLKGKVQKLKERNFGKQQLHQPHVDNPAAAVTTSLKVYNKYSLDRAYKGETFFWGLLPQLNDWIKFEFKPPIGMKGFVLRSGNPQHGDGKFINMTVEIKFVGDWVDPPVPDKVGSSWDRTPDGYFVVSSFSRSGSVQANFENTGLVECLRMVVVGETSDKWIILNEIWIKGMG